MNVKTVSPQELAREQASDESVVLLDVRTPLEFRTVHVGFAKNIPLDQLDEGALAAVADKARRLFVICHAGGRSAKACERIAAWGFRDAVSVEGGTVAWSAAGLPVVRNAKVVSLERQVRIAAGLLVLTGCALALTVHIGYIGIAAFVGMGLTFAGITDTCGMGLLLSKMPWNRGGPSAVEPSGCKL